MTNNQNETPQNDWNKLAIEALDLWQGHLNALASDPKLKEDMTQLVAPMSQMFAQWSTMMQNGLQGLSPFPSSTEASPADSAPADSTPTESEPTAKAPAPTVFDTAQESPLASPIAIDLKAPSPEALMQEIIQKTTPDHAQDNTGTPSVGATKTQAQEAPPLVATATPPEPAAEPVQQAARGRAASADGPRDLAQLAGRLAQLERELDSLRPKSKRTSNLDDSVADSADDADATDAGNVQRVAGAD